MKIKKQVTRELRALFAEVVGTFSLTFVATAAAVVVATSEHQVDFIAKAIAPGLVVMAMVYTFGNISGMHINPIVTLAFAIRRAFAWWRVPGYVLAQITGAILASLSVTLLFGASGHLGATIPHVGSTEALFMEAILTMLLVTVVIGTATGTKIVGSNAGIAVGGTIVLCAIIGSTVSGASMNPAISFGTLTFAGKMNYFWIYLLGPTMGSVLAVLLNYLTHGKKSPHEQEAASGDAKA